MLRSNSAIPLIVILAMAPAACMGSGGGQTAAAPVTVPETLAIQRPPTLKPGGSAQLRVLLVRPDRSGQDMTGSATWSSSNPGVATIGNDGVVKAVAPGTTIITAHSGGRSATAQLKVEP